MAGGEGAREREKQGKEKVNPPSPKGAELGVYWSNSLYKFRNQACCCCRFSRVRLCVTQWTAAHQGSPSLGFSRQEHWSGLPFPSPIHEKWKVKVKSLSRVWLLATPWTAAYQAPPSMGFSRQQYWSGVPLPSPGTKHPFCQKSKLTMKNRYFQLETNQGIWSENRIRLGTSLEVQWSRFRAANAGDKGLIPGQRAKIPHAMWYGQMIFLKYENRIWLSDMSPLLH